MSGLATVDFDPVTLSLPLPAQYNWQYNDSPLASQSSLSGHVQLQATFGGLFSMDMQWQSQEKKDLLPLAALLNYWGLARTFTTFLFDQPEPIRNLGSTSDSALDNLVVTGAADQSGSSLTVKDYDVGPGSTQNPIFLERGDVISILDTDGKYQLFTLREHLALGGTDPVTTAPNADGEGTAYLSNPIRAAPDVSAPNNQIYTRNAPITVRNTVVPKITTDHTTMYQLTATFVEAINV